MLKSGCRIETRPLETAARLRRCLPLDSVMAWRLLDATLLSRAMLYAPCTARLEQEEWQALSRAIHVTGTPTATPPSLGQAVDWIGGVGGFLARRGAGDPGVTALWKGLQASDRISRSCTVSCALSPRSNNMWVKTRPGLWGMCQAGHRSRC